MGRKTRRVKVSVSKILTWPQSCVLCLKSATEKDLKIGGGHVPYCKDCYGKVKRLGNWKDNIFGISLLIGVIGTVVGAIVVIQQEDWLMLLKPQSWLLIGAEGLFFMGIAYAMIWLILFLPLRLIFRSKLANPGVKILKSKAPGVMVLGFSETKYADLFREANKLSIPE